MKHKTLKLKRHVERYVVLSRLLPHLLDLHRSHRHAVRREDIHKANVTRLQLMALLEFAEVVNCGAQGGWAHYKGIYQHDVPRIEGLSELDERVFWLVAQVEAELCIKSEITNNHLEADVVERFEKYVRELPCIFHKWFPKSRKSNAKPKKGK